MAHEPRLIIQVPRAGAVAAQMAANPPESVARGMVVVEEGPVDEEGVLEPPAAGEVVLSVLSPEALEREPEHVRSAIGRAGEGTEPLVVEVEAAEELRDEELAGVLEASGHTSRAVILRVIRNA